MPADSRVALTTAVAFALPPQLGEESFASFPPASFHDNCAGLNVKGTAVPGEAFFTASGAMMNCSVPPVELVLVILRLVFLSV